MTGEVFIITESEFKQLAGQSGLVFFPSVGGIINLSSTTAVVPQGKLDRKRIKLHDGGYAIKKFGQWVCEENQEIKIDLHYYPYLIKEQTYDEYKQIESISNAKTESGLLVC